MDILDAVILGLVQGLTEFIPVSSSGHLILLDESTSVESSFAFDVLLNIGTLLALVIYFWKKLLNIATQIFKKKDYKLARNIVLSTIPAVIVGGLFADLFSDDQVRNLNVVVAMLIGVGLLMLFVDRLDTGNKEMKKLTKFDAVNIGIAQSLALIPGTSRSGSTILAGRLFGLDYKSAAEYSFLIAIPILSGAIVRSLFESDTQDLLNNEMSAVLVGIAAAFVSGLAAIHFMLSFLKKQGLKIFGIYRIILGIGLLLFVN